MGNKPPDMFVLSPIRVQSRCRFSEIQIEYTPLTEVFHVNRWVALDSIQWEIASVTRFTVMECGRTVTGILAEWPKHLAAA